MLLTTVFCIGRKDDKVEIIRLPKLDQEYD